MKTVGKEDGFRQIMACHGSTVDNPHVCFGYLAQEGERNLNVRVAVIRHEMPAPQAVYEACTAAGIRLHKNYRAVLS
jgi:hypothetical protein